MTKEEKIKYWYFQILGVLITLSVFIGLMELVFNIGAAFILDSGFVFTALALIIGAISFKVNQILMESFIQ